MMVSPIFQVGGTKHRASKSSVFEFPCFLPSPPHQLVLLELNFLPTTGTKLTKQQLILARDILEIGAQWSILRKDIPSFERYMAQLKCYYFDYKEQLPESAYMHQLLGLNLLFLLSQNRVAEFHTELERLPAKDIQTNVYIKHPVSLEQVRRQAAGEDLAKVGGAGVAFRGLS